MNKRHFFGGALLLAIFILSINGSLYAQDTQKKVIDLKIIYQTKEPTSRIYDTLAQPEVKTAEGTVANVTVGDINSEYAFKVDVTPTLDPQVPGLIILKIKAWELRDVYRDGKYVKDFVSIVDWTSRVVKGGASVTEQRVTVDRDVRITIYADYDNGDNY